MKINELDFLDNINNQTMFFSLYFLQRYKHNKFLNMKLNDECSTCSLRKNLSKMIQKDINKSYNPEHKVYLQNILESVNNIKDQRFSWVESGIIASNFGKISITEKGNQILNKIKLNLFDVYQNNHFENLLLSISDKCDSLFPSNLRFDNKISKESKYKKGI